MSADRPTPREMQILELIAHGHTVGDVARELGVAPSTIKTHLGHLRDRMRARTTAHAVAIGYERGWLGEAGVAAVIDTTLRSELWRLHLDLGAALERLTELDLR